MTSEFTDLTGTFNTNNGVTLDVSLWQEVTFQFVNPSGTIAITGTNDGGAVTGSSFGSAATAANLTAIQATKLADGTAVTSVAAAGLFKVTRGCKYIKFGGASAAADKVIVFYSKPY